MRRLSLIAALAAAYLANFLFLPQAHAQVGNAVVVSACGTPPQTYTAGQPYPTTQDTNGNQCINDSGGGGGAVTANQGTPNAGGATNSWPVQGAGVAGTPAGGVVSVQGVSGGTTIPTTDSQATAANLNAQVVGNVAAGSADSGNGVKAAGVYNSTLPTLTNGLRGDLQVGTRGSLDTQTCGANTATCAVVTNVNGDGLSASSAAIYEQAFGALWNGTTWDRAYSGGTTGSASVSGGVASAASDTGNPVKTGGVYTTGPSAVTTGQRVNLWLDQFGNPAAASYGGGETPVSCSTGNVAAATATCTMPAASGKTTYISGFDITASGATVGSVVTCTLTNTGSGTHSYTFAATAGALLSDTPLTKVFERPLAATATNTAPVLSCPSLGTGNTNMTINMDGFEK